MNEVEALKEIQRMSIDEKIAALTPADKAYVKGYIERAVLESRKNAHRGRKKNTAVNEK